MIYNQPFYSRDEIDAASPVVSRLGGFNFAKCLSTRRDNFTGANVLVVDYSDLYAWNHYEHAAVSYRRLTLRSVI